MDRNGRNFFMKSANMKSLNDVIAFYKAVRTLGPSSSFRYSLNRNFPNYRRYTEDGSDDDKDCGMGRAARDRLKKMNATNIAVFVIGQYGGRWRFKIVEELMQRSVTACFAGNYDCTCNGLVTGFHRPYSYNFGTLKLSHLMTGNSRFPLRCTPQTVSLILGMLFYCSLLTYTTV